MGGASSLFVFFILVFFTSGRVWAGGDQDFAALIRDLPSVHLKILPDIHPGDPGFENLDPDTQKDIRNVDDMEAADAANDSPWITKWIPNGKGLMPDPTGCEGKILGQFFTHQGVSPELFPFWQKCTPLYSRLVVNRLEPLVRLLGVQYQVLQHPYIRRVLVRTREGVKIKGFMALQPTLEPRPLVIVRCGIVCNATLHSPMLMETLMHLYDEGSFHVLLLGNGTGTAFARDNAYFAIAGVEDGRINSEVVKIFTDPNLAFNQHISSVHMVGISLGGHGALYSDLYESLNKGGPKVASVTAVCPVVDLQPTINFLFSNDAFEAKFITGTLWPTLKSAQPDITNFQLYFPAQEPSRDQFPGVIGHAMQEWYLNWKSHFDWTNTPFANAALSTLDEAWRANRFEDYVDQLKIPTLLLAADDDQLVNPEVNTKLLISMWHSPQHGMITALVDNTGNHCGFGTSLGWGNFSTLLTSFIVANSPELMSVPHIVPFPPADWSGLKLVPGQSFYDQTWSLTPGSTKAVVTFRIYNPWAAKICGAIDPVGLPDECFFSYSTDVNLKLLGLPKDKFNYSHPWGEVETEALTRWLNTNVRVLGQRMDQLHTAADWPTWLEWHEIKLSKKFPEVGKLNPQRLGLN